jgi:hypothetical protein
MGHTIICNGSRLFGQELPPFTLPEGGVMVIKSDVVTPEAQCAQILLCEALSGTVTVEGLRVLRPFHVAHPYLRAFAFDLDVAGSVFRPRERLKFMINYVSNSARIRELSNSNFVNLETLLTEGKNVVFSFAGLGYRGAERIKHLVLGRPPNATAVGIEGVTTNFSVDQFLPGVTVLRFRAEKQRGT